MRAWVSYDWDRESVPQYRQGPDEVIEVAQGIEVHRSVAAEERPNLGAVGQTDKAVQGKEAKAARSRRSRA